jgi:hypothetical protein
MNCAVVQVLNNVDVLPPFGQPLTTTPNPLKKGDA